MTDPGDRWLQMCRKTGIDPREVRLIHARFDAYRRFTTEKTGHALPVEQWFGFYLLEKNSEGRQAGVAAEGCTADGDAVNQACLQRPEAFLAVLKVYDEAPG